MDIPKSFHGHSHSNNKFGRTSATYETAPLVLLAELKNKFNDCGVCEGEAVCVQVYLLRDGAKEMFEVYTAEEISSNAHIYHVPWPVAVNTLIQQFLTKDMRWEAHYLVIRISQWPDEDEL